MEQERNETAPLNTLGLPTIDREQHQPQALWEDDETLETCPIQVPVEQWQRYLQMRQETLEMLQEVDYPDDPQKQAEELALWERQNRPEPITLSERIQGRIDLIHQQLLAFQQENGEYNEETGELMLYQEAQKQFQEYEMHLNWLRARQSSLWEPESEELQTLDRQLWIAENLWQDRLSPEPEIEDRIWEDSWRLESALISKHPHP